MEKQLGIYHLLLTIGGPLANCLTSIVCLRKNLRHVPTFVFLAFVSILDTIPLFLYNLNIFVMAYFRGMESPVFCVIFPALHSASLEASSWILVSMTIERCLSVKIKTWRMQFFNSKKAVILSIIIATVFFLLNFQQFFNGPYIEVESYDGNVSWKYGMCQRNDLFLIWAEFQTYAYSIIPSIVIGIANCVLVYTVLCGNKEITNRSETNKSKRKSLTISVIFASLCFVVFTFPHAIVVGYFINDIYTNEVHLKALFIAGALSFTYQSLHIAILILTNKQFLKELKNMAKLNKTNRVNITTTRTFT